MEGREEVVDRDGNKGEVEGVGKGRKDEEWEGLWGRRRKGRRLWIW